MNLKWYNGLKTDQEKAEFKARLLSSKPVLEKLTELLEAELERSLVELSKKDKFYLPAYSEYLAHSLGEQEALRTVINLLKESHVR